MNRFSLVVFDGYMSTAGTSINFNTGPGTERLLGLFDRLSIQAIVTDVAGTAPITFQAAIVHSGNGRAFQPKNVTAEINAAPVVFRWKYKMDEIVIV